MSAGSLTPTQRAYNLIRDEAAAAAINPDYRLGLLRALELLKEVDPDADSGEHVPGRVYGPH
jgi:hypothetical protein